MRPLSSGSEPGSSSGSSLFRRHPHFLVLLALVGLTVFMTWPQVSHLGNGVRDRGDPLLNTWILWWEIDCVLRGDLATFFDTNIFFPHLGTLAYSELLIPQAIVAAPFLLASGNPLLAYNVTVLLSFVATGFSMYLLGRHLTGRSFAAFVSALAFAFTPFLFGQLSHLQFLCAAGVPLSFLFLHRYFDSGSLKHLLAFSVIFAAQALANTHYGLYLTYFAGAFILYRAWNGGLLRQTRFWLHMSAHAVVSFALLAPFYGRYLVVHRELGYSRGILYEGGWFSFFAAPPSNLLYGDLSAGLRAAEGELFAGFAVLLLAMVGLLSGRAPAAAGRRATGGRALDPQARAYRWAGLLLAFAWLLVVAMSVSRGFDLDILGRQIRVRTIEVPMLAIALLLVLRLWLRRRRPGLGRPPWLLEPQRFYAYALAAAALLSLGPDSPYELLYDWVPGFGSIRAVTRIHIMSVFALAVLVCFGTAELLERLSSRRRAAAMVAIPALICLEFFSAPLPLVEAPPIGDDLPEVYSWLAAREGDYATIEYPLRHLPEHRRIYYSMYHGGKLVNGVSGYYSPIYEELRRRSEESDFPSSRSVADLRQIGVRWVIFHPRGFRGEWGSVRRRLNGLRRELKLVERFDNALVYQVRGGEWLDRQQVHERLRARSPAGVALSRDGWSVSATPNGDLAALAIDGDPSTRWHSDPQRTGDWFAVDLGRSRAFGGIVLRGRSGSGDHPRGYLVEASDDGLEWRTLAVEDAPRLPLIAFLEPLKVALEITFADTEARHLRIVQTGEDPSRFWSIGEIDILRGHG